MICPYKSKCSESADRDMCNIYFEVCAKYAWYVEDEILGDRDLRSVESGFKKLLETEENVKYKC